MLEIPAPRRLCQGAKQRVINVDAYLPKSRLLIMPSPHLVHILSRKILIGFNIFIKDFIIKSLEYTYLALRRKEHSHPIEY